ncbi:MAG: hypothetical protein ABW352_25320 [Polyangiales bacterium]
MSIRSAERRWWSALCAVLFCVVGSAHAQESNVAGAAEAFSKAQKAELAGDFQEAASLYALADEMAPAAAALRGAARSAKQAGLNATAATHAATLLAREKDPATRTFAEEILRDTAGQLAHLQVSCDEPCKLMIDGRITATRRGELHELYARPGERAITASFEQGNAPAQSVSLSAGGSSELSFAAPRAAVQPAIVAVDTGTRAEPRDKRKISPWYFASAGALTLVAGGLTVWSGLKVNSAHDDYDRRSSDAQRDYDDGRKLEKRTNALIGVTGGLAAATVVLAIFTDFKGRESRTAQGLRKLRLATDARGATLGWQGAF